MNVGFEEKHLEGVPAHFNAAKTREASSTDNQNVTEHVEKTEEVDINRAVVLQIGKSEDGTSGTNKLCTEQVRPVDEKKCKDTVEETNRQKASFDMVTETQRRLLENFNI